jgi:hypothetical protein
VDFTITQFVAPGLEVKIMGPAATLTTAEVTEIASTMLATS